MAEEDSVMVQAMKLLSDPQFNKLSQRLSRVNVFDVIDMGRQEIKHSAFLAWLMDPASPHGLGDLFIRRLLAQLYRENIQNHHSDELANDFASLAADDLTEIEVVREREAHIDILVKTLDNRMVICIENKVDAWLHDNQLFRYREYVENTYAGYAHKIYIFLTPKGERVPEDQSDEPDSWLTLSYTSIVTVLKSIETLARGRAKELIDDYIDFLEKENLVKNDELDDLALNLYRKYPAVFDLVHDRAVPDNDGINTELRQMYLKVLNEFKQKDDIDINDCEPEDSTSDYLFFTTSRMNEYLENKTHSGAWTEPYASYNYWVYPGPGGLQKPSIVFEIHRAGQPTRILNKMDMLQHYCSERGGIEKTSNKELDLRRIYTIDTGIDETDKLRVNELGKDEEDNAKKLRNAVEKCLVSKMTCLNI
ncbi:PD-(D/E)XK nuclease family protein [Bifidobacterium sp. ESL0745]|uniref:PDDEXK-like family protein n=1 Tax=Bifidobacterium sp. ESL0745 TaxID=2983226 RepID=UPI0023F9D2A6|nr:PD-(D/E)XK nuclease family protein [Bifidobacterium sp. ESL0745]MDF7665261.1 PD-(D/E)XK nuclease family protein [Bifidobacterium sp. ESL0745]